MARKLNEHAWEILTQDEKEALKLQLGLGKSSWQSGEIMERSHYKYLEIKYRAEHFLKMFTEHMDLYQQLIPLGVNGNKEVNQYITHCIQHRRKPMQALKLMGGEKKLAKGVFNEKLIKQLEDWEDSTNAHENVLHNLIMEFDRWNNFRILPKVIQEPSAFKRRVKNTYKKQLKVMLNIPSFCLDKLAKNYKIKPSSSGSWWPHLYEGEIVIHKVKVNNQSYKIFNQVGFYLFDRKVDAQEYIESIQEYTSKKSKDCRDGLNFWPKYRELIEKAKNYHRIQKISPTRRWLKMAMAKLEFL